jgi:hypothetical protein
VGSRLAEFGRDLVDVEKSKVVPSGHDKGHFLAKSVQFAKS